MQLIVKIFWPFFLFVYLYALNLAKIWLNG